MKCAPFITANDLRLVGAAPVLTKPSMPVKSAHSTMRDQGTRVEELMLDTMGAVRQRGSDRPLDNIAPFRQRILRVSHDIRAQFISEWARRMPTYQSSDIFRYNVCAP